VLLIERPYFCHAQVQGRFQERKGAWKATTLPCIFPCGRGGCSYRWLAPRSPAPLLRHLSYASGELVCHALDLPGERRGQKRSGLFCHSSSIQRGLGCPQALRCLCNASLDLLIKVTLEAREDLVLKKPTNDVPELLLSSPVRAGGGVARG